MVKKDKETISIIKLCFKSGVNSTFLDHLEVGINFSKTLSIFDSRVLCSSELESYMDLTCDTPLKLISFPPSLNPGSKMKIFNLASKMENFNENSISTLNDAQG